MKGRNIFLSYASGNFLAARNALCHSALTRGGFDEAYAYGPENIDPIFVSKYHEILSRPRGAGYWLWKPQIILQELKKLEPNDLLVYSDAGRSNYYRFKRFPSHLAKSARERGFLLGPTIGQHGSVAIWSKRDAFLLLDMDQHNVHERAPIQATWSFWTPSTAAIRFLEYWRDACCDPRILTDMENTQGLPNLPGFRDHRHDQSALSLLAYREDAPHLDYRNRLFERILRLRPQSRLAHVFLKRIEDAESLESGLTAGALLRAFYDIYRKPRI